MTASSQRSSAPSGAAFLGLGSNLGDRRGHIQEGLFFLGDRGVRPVRVSFLYDTDPVGLLEQGNFLNLVLEVRWRGNPGDLLSLCQEAERAAGRIREVPGGPRTLDVDILLCGDRISREARLEIPHPRLHLRRFVLAPLGEIAPEVIHPVLGKTISDLLAACPDDSGVRRLPDRLSLEREVPPRL
jgi:2-amino-4-hydroxy-6-hydroxymethyldihydropteridine diphosphokinase